MKIRVWLIAVPGLVISSPAYAEWFRVGSDVNGSVWSMDANRIKTVGGKRQAWIKIDASGDRSVNWRTGLRLLNFDCDAGKYRLLTYVSYDSYGKVIQSNSRPDSEYGAVYEPLVPDSMAEMASTVACNTPKSSDE